MLVELPLDKHWTNMAGLFEEQFNRIKSPVFEGTEEPSAAVRKR